MQKALLIPFLAVIALVPALQTALGPPPPYRLLGLGHRARNLREFETRIDEDSIFASRARPAVQRLTFALGEAGEKVVVGEGGVLYYRDDVRYLVEPVTLTGPVEAIRDMHRQLGARGIRLVVMPVPVKPHPRGVRSPAMELLVELRRIGVETIDLFDQSRDYLKLDTHWTPATARAAAEFVAPLLGIEPGTSEYSEIRVPASRRGDLAQMLSIRDRFPLEPVEALQVAGPLTDALSPLLVLGDSFLRIYETDEPRGAGFIAHLARSLRRPVTAIVNDGGASTLVRQDLSRRSRLLEAKKVVLWEFVERDLRFGAEGWQKVPLQ
jgi:hypothetical protein